MSTLCFIGGRARSWWLTCFFPFQRRFPGGRVFLCGVSCVCRDYLELVPSIVYSNPRQGSVCSFHERTARIRFRTTRGGSLAASRDGRETGRRASATLDSASILT